MVFLWSSLIILPLLPLFLQSDMEPSKAQGKRSLKYGKIEEDDNTEEEEDEEDEDEEEEYDDDVVSRGATGFSSGGDEYTIRKKRPMITSTVSPSAGGGRARGGGSGSSTGGSTVRPSCQADHCNADLSEAKHYHRRHKICEVHAKAQVVLVSSLQQRFCQQCSRFHELSEFDDAKRSCRRRLAGHNARRRKNTSDIQREGSN